MKFPMPEALATQKETEKKEVSLGVALGYPGVSPVLLKPTASGPVLGTISSLPCLMALWCPWGAGARAAGPQKWWG